MDSDRIRRGMIAQNYAEQFLAEKGYSLIARNWRASLGEVDLVAKDKEELVFVEVKSMIKQGSSFQPEDHLTPTKQKKLSQLALAYLNYKNLGDVDYRVDLVAVDLDEDLQALDIRHYESVVGDEL